MLDKMEKRRKWKNVNTVQGRMMYRKLNNELRRETDKARSSWWEFHCNELEDLERMGRSDLVYAKVNELSKEKREGKKQDSVLSKDGILLTEANDINSRWKEYIEDLYASGERPDELPLELEEEVDEDDRGPDILKEEILQAIDHLTDGKSEGADGVPAEMWKVLGAEGLKALVDWPEDWMKVILRVLTNRQFSYLGSILTQDGYCDVEIKSRIARAKDTFSKRKELLTKSFSLPLKKRIIKTVIWSTLLYGAETWAMRKEEISRIESCEMWLWRKTMKILWSDKVSNEVVLRRIERSLVDTIRRRQKAWLGHTLRHRELLVLMLEGRVEGKRPPGRRRCGILDDVKRVEGSYERVKRRGEGRML
ncbi:hypothetical protein JOB18_038345 [Solea senegalensis]|uniref:Reverse transcriptase n=1 Tax=Solea senegalensis TaxID=28829 RepID=A0AAV6QT17_SOLSE|nr:hypothetical protein JOB18_038345 [Solea senegalensis]